jgi:uncharacterized membrane protein YecN with MAPEG domain
MIFLTGKVVAARVRNEVYIGDRISSSSDPKTDPLLIATRQHSNFLENVPMALLLCAVAEISGADRSKLHYAMAALFALRIGHTFALEAADNCGPGRPIALFGGNGIVAVLAGYSAYLVKGYWRS